MDREFKSWQRYIYKLERELKTLDERETSNTTALAARVKTNFKAMSS